MKFLGIIIDRKLTWKDHIMYISGKIARGIGIIVKARKNLNSETLLSLYHSFIYPYFIFCNHVWGNAAHVYLNKMIVLQKRVVRIIAGVKPKEHSDPLFTKLSLLKITEIHPYIVGRLMFRIYKGEYESFHEYFKQNSEIHTHDTRQSEHYHIPHVRSGKRSLWSEIME